VTAADVTHWSQRRNGNSEWVDLENGTAFLEVRKQRPDEHFFVELPDGEIEVRGTKFEVTVEEHRTIQIHVVEGVVAFIRPNGDEVVLHANETWRRKEPVAVASAPRPVAPPIAHRVEEDHAPRDYEAAMAAYRDGDYTAAGERFSQFLVDHPTSREAEDAAFMEANSAAHAGRNDVAAVLAEKFLKRYPDSFHARDAATLVARGGH
jgi:TolA-binding protein